MKALISNRWPLSLVTVLTVVTTRGARAEQTLAYKYADYREAGDRVSVQTQSALLAADLGLAGHVKLTGTLDAIAGATPTGQPAPADSPQVPLSELHEHRKAWTADFSRQLPRVNFALGFGNSRESDYVSNGWSLNAVTDFNQKNTTLLTGVAGTSDDVKVFFQTERAKKYSNDVIIGVTQLLDRRTSVSFNLTWGRATGYLSDPYKLVQKDIEILPDLFLTRTFRENRPGLRNKGIALLALNHSFAELHGTIDATYRFYHDTFGITANTVDLTWLQRFGSRVILSSGLRFYAQNAAEFYYYDLNRTAIMPVRSPDEGSPNYSSDFRLSAMHTGNLALKLIWNPSSWLQLDAAIEHYVMRGRDGMTPQSAYARATTFTVGVSLTH